MATFRVGQRVKLVRGVSAKNYGLTGTITEFEFLPVGTPCDGGDIVKPSGIDSDCKVLYDGDTKHSVEHTSRLEPLYDGHSKVSWSECLWAPNKETA